MLDRLRSYKSLVTITQPKPWWKCSKLVDHTSASRAINRFRAAMTGLENKDKSMATFGTSDEEGCVKLCQFCHSWNNDECHIESLSVPTKIYTLQPTQDEEDTITRDLEVPRCIPWQHPLHLQGLVYESLQKIEPTQPNLP